MWCYVVWWNLLPLLPWRWRHQVPSKCCDLFAMVSPNKTAILRNSVSMEPESSCVQNSAIEPWPEPVRSTHSHLAPLSILISSRSSKLRSSFAFLNENFDVQFHVYTQWLESHKTCTNDVHFWQCSAGNIQRLEVRTKFCLENLKERELCNDLYMSQGKL
jgi:hypothetical protein